jgi:hypothetical protein
VLRCLSTGKIVSSASPLLQNADIGGRDGQGNTRELQRLYIVKNACLPHGDGSRSHDSFLPGPAEALAVLAPDADRDEGAGVAVEELSVAGVEDVDSEVEAKDGDERELGHDPTLRSQNNVPEPDVVVAPPRHQIRFEIICVGCNYFGFAHFLIPPYSAVFKEPTK